MKGGKVPIKLDEKTLNKVKEYFARLESNVVIYYAIDDEEGERGEFSRMVEEILKLLSGLSNKLTAIKMNESLEHEFNIDKRPAIVIHGKDKYNIRYFGVPAGYEFGVIIEDIVYASKGTPDLPKEVLLKLREINEKVHIQVFVTPTCPYCPIAAKAAHMYAIANLNITSDVVEVSEFPELAEKYNIFAVPKIVINDKVEVEGAIPHEFFIEKILEAIS